MAEKKHEQTGFTVTDRRLFTSDGELRSDVPEEIELPKEVPLPPANPPKKEAASAEMHTPQASSQAESDLGRDMPTPPTSAEQEAQAAAYRQSANDLDAQVELSGQSAKDFEITFERFLASLYMTAMIQLGLMRQPNEQPRIDLIGARQTIDTLTLISEKTKGNLTSTEQNFLQNSLYELRMAYVEVTNALARPQAGPATGTGGR